MIVWLKCYIYKISTKSLFCKQTISAGYTHNTGLIENYGFSVVKAQQNLFTFRLSFSDWTLKGKHNGFGFMLLMFKIIHFFIIKSLFC